MWRAARQGGSSRRTAAAAEARFARFLSGSGLTFGRSNNLWPMSGLWLGALFALSHTGLLSGPREGVFGGGPWRAEAGLRAMRAPSGRVALAGGSPASHTPPKRGLTFRGCNRHNFQYLKGYYSMMCTSDSEAL